MARSSGDRSGSDSGPSFNVDVSSPAVVFAVFYAIMLFYIIRKAMQNPTSVFIFLSLFCAIRVAGFAIRATAEDSDDVELGLFVAMGVLYDAGISALLYSAYILVLDRGIVSGNAAKTTISRITSNRNFIRLLLSLATVIDIAAWVSFAIIVENRSSSDPSFPLQETGVGIFLLTTFLLAVQTAFQLRWERSALGRGLLSEPSPGPAYGMYIPSLIVILLLIRGMYRTVSITINLPQSKALWYSLGPLPELLAVFLFPVTGLVPEKKDLVPRAHEHKKDPEVTGSA